MEMFYVYLEDLEGFYGPVYKGLEELTPIEGADWDLHHSLDTAHSFESYKIAELTAKTLESQYEVKPVVLQRKVSNNE